MTPVDQPIGRYAAIVLAAGSSSRIGEVRNKVYLPLAGRSVVTWPLEVFSRLPGVERLILVIRADERQLASEILQRELPGVSVELVDGGDSRHSSEYNALEYLAPTILAGRLDIVLIHDGDRPCVTQTLAHQVANAALTWGGAVPGTEANDLLPLSYTDPLVEGNCYMRSQTPQAFRASALLAAYRQAQDESFRGTDTSESVERYGNLNIRAVPGDRRNIKITYSQDLFDAEHLLRSQLSESST